MDDMRSLFNRACKLYRTDGPSGRGSFKTNKMSYVIRTTEGDDVPKDFIAYLEEEYGLKITEEVPACKFTHEAIECDGKCDCYCNTCYSAKATTEYKK